MKTLLALSALTLTRACLHPVDTADAPSFGASVQAMHSNQATPEAVSDEAPEGSGAVGALAQERYRTGRTRPLMSTTTSSANPSSN
jgi:hypothetical protein